MRAHSAARYPTKSESPQHIMSQQNIHTPPASDRSSHGKAGEEDDKDDEADVAASSSDLSDLDDQFEADAPPPSKVEPDRYEGGIPIFQPTMDQFRDFEKYMNAVNPYGMQSGIVLIDPPPEWKAERKALDNMVKTIKVRNPITQEFHHNEYGIYTQRNMEKLRTYNLPQWKALCEQSQYQPPARRGERRKKADALPGAKIVPLKRKSDSVPVSRRARQKTAQSRGKVKNAHVDGDDHVLERPTPTSPGHSRGDAFTGHEESVPGPVTSPRRGRGASRGRGRGGARSAATGRPKNAPRAKAERGAGSKATTVAARRLRTTAEGGGDDINEEDFEGFDYRIHNHHEWTRERCEELEEKYWKSLSYTNPMYGADMPGSLFEEDTTCWNVAKLPNLLDILGSKIPGVNTAYLYLGMWRATFAWHLEDVDLYSINYIHFGAPKQWYSISQADAPKFEKAMRCIYSNEAKTCDQFLRHKTFLVSPSLLKNKYGVSVNRVVHREGQFVVTFPIGYHSGYNLGYNCAESVNFALESWLPYGQKAKKCQCEDDSVFIDVDWFVRRLKGEPTPEVEEWVEVTDDEDDQMPAMDLPTPPESERSQLQGGKRKRRSNKDAGAKKTKRIKIKISRTPPPCGLCPNNFTCDEVLPTDDGRNAHRRCALYTPETYLDEVDGKELIRGMAEISKARLELRCNECRQKRGSCFQCSSAKCTRAYHATCAAQAGVQVDIGDVAVWHQGVEYRDTGLDFRCKLHRSVKMPKHSSDLARDNYRHFEKNRREFRQYLANLKARDVVQYQSSHADDIEAGVLVEPFDQDEGILVLDLLPTGQRRYVEVHAVLFVDAATSCLQRPSPTAKELPRDLRGQALSGEDGSNRKPSRLDPFCTGLDPSSTYRWEEFNSATPPPNQDQKAVDLGRDGRLWHYIGSKSTDSKASYTGDPSRPVHDPAANFLHSAEAIRRPSIVQPIPTRHPTLPIGHLGSSSLTEEIRKPLGATGSPSHLPTSGHPKKQRPRDPSQRPPPPPPPPPSSWSPGTSVLQLNSPSHLPLNVIHATSLPPTGRPAGPPGSTRMHPSMLEIQPAKILTGQPASTAPNSSLPHHEPPTTSSVPPLPHGKVGPGTSYLRGSGEMSSQPYPPAPSGTQLSSHSPRTHGSGGGQGAISVAGIPSGLNGVITPNASASLPDDDVLDMTQKSSARHTETTFSAHQEGSHPPIDPRIAAQESAYPWNPDQRSAHISNVTQYHAISQPASLPVSPAPHQPAVPNGLSVPSIAPPTRQTAIHSTSAIFPCPSGRAENVLFPINGSDHVGPPVRSSVPTMNAERSHAATGPERRNTTGASPCQSAESGCGVEASRIAQTHSTTSPHVAAADATEGRTSLPSSRHGILDIDAQNREAKEVALAESRQETISGSDKSNVLKGGRLAETFYAARSPDEKKLIDAAMEKIGSSRLESP